jgi:serine/threonine protein kinase
MNSIGETREVRFILNRIDILQDIESEAMRDIARSVELASFKRGETLISRGQQSERLYMIFSGEVEVLIPDVIRGIDRKVTLSKGAVVGEISLLTKEPYSADVVATKDTSVLFLNRKIFNRLIQSYKSFASRMSSLVSERMAQSGGINQVGDYQLLKRLGEGSMAIVFQAYDPALERDVAIKMLKYELSHDQDFLSRFAREAKIIARLNHPNIVHVHEVLNELSTSFMVMERLTGMDLSAVLKQKFRLSLAQARRILTQVAAALEYAHNEGIVHRDVKPSNIIINQFNHVKITDFGLAKPPDDKNENIEGSPHYLAPEIIQSLPVDGRADIYAMGIMAFHMLTGSPPFTAKSLDKILDMHVNKRPPDIHSYRNDIDQDMALFIERALEKDASKRINGWKEIKKLLKSKNRSQTIKVTEDDVVFLTRLKGSSYKNAARIIRSLKDTLKAEGIEHEISIQREETTEDTMTIIAFNPDKT